MDVIISIPPKLNKDDWVSIDIELFNAIKHKLHLPTTGEYAMVSFCSNSEPEKVYVVRNLKDIKQALDNVNDATWIFHNAAFDITHLRRWASIEPRNKLWDTMIVERIMCGGLYDKEGYSLDNVVRRRLDIRMDKEIRKTFSENKEKKLTKEQILYGAIDAYLTLQVCNHQKKQITRKDFRVWKDIDRDAMWAIIDFKGMRINVDDWTQLANQNQETANTLGATLDINPNSPQQVKDLLLNAGFKKLPNTERKTLDKWMEKYPKADAFKLSETILEYRTYARRASTYGLNLLKKHLENEDDVDVIHAGYWVVGTEHGRTSSTNPNFQNIPVREVKDFRKCFIARPNNKLVICDMGQQETRIGAYLSQDRKLIELLSNHDEDIFVAMTRLMYKIEILKNDPFRKKTKNTVYGVNYGMSADGFAERYGGTQEEAQEAIDLYFRTFPDFYSWIVEQRKKRNFVETIYGRRVWLNPYSDQTERNAVNSPISGSAADQMKMALGNIHKKWDFPFPFCCVGYIHDEVIFDVPEIYADEVGEFISKEMISAAEVQCPGVPFTAEYKVCDDWSEKE